MVRIPIPRSRLRVALTAIVSNISALPWTVALVICVAFLQPAAAAPAPVRLKAATQLVRIAQRKAVSRV